MSEMSFENHIMTQFDEELEEIRTRLMEMGGKVNNSYKMLCALLVRVIVLLLRM